MKSYLQHAWRMILRGLLAVIPIAVTLYLVFWLAFTAEWMLGLAVKLITPEGVYLPGMGLILALGILYGLGWLVDHWLLKRLIEGLDSLLIRMPLINKIHGAVKDLIRYFSARGPKAFDQVVTIELIGQDMTVLGLVTRDDLRDLPQGLASEHNVAVYIPGSYQIGGFTVMVPRHRLSPVDMPIDDALRFAITGAMSVTARNGHA
ncbi:MAG: DUF502 domain-containing protein [Ectothiorhodospiraceae bacterium]|nr:DUF502 domain-containing protein [Ectothiorhodospiraceae bacterium]MCH8504588.1 DUF502 domain-containing protein [Ectothiorhodospiraceae bacterium]